jgi:predicted small lipoprotein YifL
MPHLLAALTTLLLLGGCGQTGPLYLPQEEAPPTTPVETEVEASAEDA